MDIRGVAIEDTFAEAFGMRAARVLITAVSARWAREAALKMTGFATSVIACKCEAAIEREWTPDQTPDARPGVSVLIFTMDSEGLEKRLTERIGQTVLTCPTTSCFDGLPDAADRLPAGRALRVFGDGFQISKVVGGRRFWRVPVMDGEFLCEETTGMVRAVGGGNFLVLAEHQGAALAAVEAAIEAMRRVPNVIMPFPGGVVRSGSKVGSKYKAMVASTNDAFCPTLRGVTKTELTPDIGCVMEIVIDGLTEADVRNAMQAGMQAVCALGAAKGIRRISAGNYGGKLGPFHFKLHEIMKGAA